MESIYQNLQKLFDVFTKGALLHQGSNSDYLLRTIYQSLDENFLNIIQDTKSVDKIAEQIRQNQGKVETSIANQTANNQVVNASETTRKVVTKTLDPNDCDPIQVVMDFNDELQSSILQVRLNLTREYERQKLEYQKSLKGQQEDLNSLNDAFKEQDNKLVDTLTSLTSEGDEWKRARLNDTASILQTMNGIVQQSNINELKKLDIPTDKKEIKQDYKYDPRNIIKSIVGENRAVSASIGNLDKIKDDRI